MFIADANSYFFNGCIWVLENSNEADNLSIAKKGR